MLVVASNKKPKVGKPHTYKKLIKRRLKNKKTHFQRMKNMNWQRQYY